MSKVPPFGGAIEGRQPVARLNLESTLGEVAGAVGDAEQSVTYADRSGDAFQRLVGRGLLTRAWLRVLTGAYTGPESAQEDLDEAWEIAERGPMKLFLADIHLYRARLFGAMNGGWRIEDGREQKYPWESPAADLAAARKLIESCGYGRRREELEDAERAIRGLP